MYWQRYQQDKALAHPMTSGSRETLTSQPEANPQSHSSLASEKTKPRHESSASLKGGEGESPIPEDKEQNALEDLEEDWQHDPINPRNWTNPRKYANMSLVRQFSAREPLFHRD